MHPLELVAPLTPLLMIPLGYGAVARRVSYPLLFACAMPVAISFALDYGVIAALLTLPWVGFTLMEAVRAVAGPKGRTLDLAVLLASLVLAAGSGSLGISRLGLGAEPLQTSDERLLLVSIHCWYAGFGMLMLAAAAGRALGGEPLVWRICVWGVTAGLTALVGGTMAGGSVPMLDHLGGAVLALAAVVLSALAMFASARLGGIAAKVRTASHLCFSASAACLVVAMSATAYLVVRGLASGGVPLPPIAPLADVHGIASAVGVIAGLCGWALVKLPSHHASGHHASGHHASGHHAA
ncbi:MAG: YndJ family transporter [Bryobacterales bacterium]|nr:YndJ family transporter [Bryobacterales bacterium]